MNNASRQHPLLRILVVIINVDKLPAITELLNGLYCYTQNHFRANGTATSEILNILGLGATEKAVATYILPNSLVSSALQNLSEEFSFRLPGKGIAFTIPVSGISGRALALVNHGASTLKDESEVINMEVEIGHHLIVVSVNQGYSEEIISAARQVGATGGTVWSARTANIENMTNLLGTSMQGEREIIAILSEKSKKLEIMQSLNEGFGVSSKAQGIVISLPVDHVAGLGKE